MKDKEAHHWNYNLMKSVLFYQEKLISYYINIYM